MINFLKGIIVGLGGIAPGLSGSVLLVIFKLYEKTIEAFQSLFKNFKKNSIFLIQLFAGFGVGVLVFSKIAEYLIANFEMQTRFMFLGLVLGTIPLFYKEVKKKGFNNKYYIPMAISAALGFLLLSFNKNIFPEITNPNIIQSIILGFAAAGSAMIPGIDSAVILSAFGLYKIYVSSIANMNISVLAPAAFGLGLGALMIAYFMNRLLKKHYTLTFSIIFGLFVAIIPNILNESCYFALDIKMLISVLLLIAGAMGSYFLGKINIM